MGNRLETGVGQCGFMKESDGKESEFFKGKSLKSLDKSSIGMINYPLQIKDTGGYSNGIQTNRAEHDIC